jgi:hypothetical protein
MYDTADWLHRYKVFENAIRAYLWSGESVNPNS